MEIPQAPLLSDAELRARDKRLAVSLRKLRQLNLQFQVSNAEHQQHQQ